KYDFYTRRFAREYPGMWADFKCSEGPRGKEKYPRAWGYIHGRWHSGPYYPIRL
ncbi:hypothetical protein DM02DRAFT_525054, partial [Periconia macrospinosa]